MSDLREDLRSESSLCEVAIKHELTLTSGPLEKLPLGARYVGSSRSAIAIHNLPEALLA